MKGRLCPNSVKLPIEYCFSSFGRGPGEASAASFFTIVGREIIIRELQPDMKVFISVMPNEQHN